jgi:hypothetical protein
LSVKFFLDNQKHRAQQQQNLMAEKFVTANTVTAAIAATAPSNARLYWQQWHIHCHHVDLLLFDLSHLSEQ